jgi:sigma-B regulation protein RsbU (phosphoserine phosphatase)
MLKPNTSTSWVFFMLCFTLGTYIITAFEMMSTYYVVHLHFLIYPFYSPTFFHLGLIFPERKPILSRMPRLQYVIYLPAVILAAGYQTYLLTYEETLRSGALSWFPNLKQIGTLNRFFALFCALSLVVFVLHALYKAATSAARQRAKMILFGVSIAFVPAGISMLMSITLKVHIPWNLLVFAVIFFPASIAYSIVRHNLFDSDEIIRRTVGYVVVTGIVVAAYAVVSVTFNVILGKAQVAQSRAFPILFTLGVILVFNPLRDRVQALVDRIFFRKEYDYGEIIDKIGGAMTSLLDLDQILRSLTKTFMDDMFINTSSVMLLNPAKAEYRICYVEGERRADVEGTVFGRDDPLMQIVEKERRELTKNDVLEDPHYESVREDCSKNFETVNASLMVPMVFKDQVIGFFNLGEKKSGKFYNRQDIDLFHALANQGAVAIENARLFQENLEKQRMEEELAIARDLQTSMLPATCPQIAGFEIAALSTPAREVGGDFFDFIDIGDGKLGVIIGDVTGKSVSGALVMSASRSVFRMLSEEALTVGEIMIRANRRTKKDITPGMFVALLYAVLDAKARTLSLCSAGQTQPIYLSGETDKASLVETQGDTFPLGILEKANYEETQLQLKTGDVVVLYTDGIVEAMNAQGDMFGFERLLEVAEKARSMQADALLEEIINGVNAFVGGTAQHDDITVIVLRVSKND